MQIIKTNQLKTLIETPFHNTPEGQIRQVLTESAKCVQFNERLTLLVAVTFLFVNKGAQQRCVHYLPVLT